MSLTAMKGSHYARGAMHALQASRSRAWLLPLTSEVVHTEVLSEKVPDKVMVVLDEFPDIFEEPKGLHHLGVMTTRYTSCREICL